MEPDVQEEERGFFAATNGSPNSTAVALSLQVCSSCDRHSKNTRTYFFTSIKIKQEIYTCLPNQKTWILKKLSTEETVHTWDDSQSHNQTHVCTYTASWKACSFSLQKSEEQCGPSALTKNTQRHPLKNLACCLFINVSLFQNNELETTQFSNHLLLKVHFLTSSFSYLYTHRHTHTS